MTSSDESGNKASEEALQSGDLLHAIDSAIRTIETQLKSKGAEKVSLTDLVRLLQLRKELEADRPRRVNARWIDDECKTSID